MGFLVGDRGLERRSVGEGLFLKIHEIFLLCFYIFNLFLFLPKVLGQTFTGAETHLWILLSFVYIITHSPIANFCFHSQKIIANYSSDLNRPINLRSNQCRFKL